MTADCQKYCEETGWPAWYGELEDNVPTATVLDAMVFKCAPNPDKTNNAAYQIYLSCRSCDGARTQLNTSYAHTVTTDEKLAQAKLDKAAVEQQLEQAKQQLKYWKEREAEIRKFKADQEANWLPQKSMCYSKYQEIEEVKKEHMRKCAPSYYDRSCEKVCIESTQEGCGVVEGTRPISEFLHGGVRSTCKPPARSWINGPWTWESDIEHPSKQCQRILDHQRVHYAQKTLISGWLSKQGRVNGWKKRYFALESGDEVRTAILRYWYADPRTDPKARERYSKSTIMWDAKNVKHKSYGWSDSNCLKIYHFYGKQRYCVPDSEGNAKEKRDSWVSLLKRAIRHPS